MTSEDKYLMGMLWKFGTIKPGTNQFVFQSYDKLEQMEYIRSRLAPSKAIKVSTRKDPRSGVEKTLYRLNFTNEEWAEKVRSYNGINAKKIADKNFVRGFLEAKGSVSNGTYRRFFVGGTIEEINMVRDIISCECKIDGFTQTLKNSQNLSYGYLDIELIKKSIGKNSIYWNEIVKKMNPVK